MFATAVVENDNIRTLKFCKVVEKHIYVVAGVWNITIVLL